MQKGGKMLPIRSLPQPEFKNILQSTLMRKTSSRKKIPLLEERYVSEESGFHEDNDEVYDAEWSYAAEDRAGQSLSQRWKRYRQIMKLFFRKGVVVNLMV